MERIKSLLGHRILLSVGLTETSGFQTVRVRSAYLVLVALFAFSGWFVMAMGGGGVGLASARLKASLTGDVETKYYLDMITELRAQRDAEREQVKLIAQELGVLQARLDRFDALGNKLRAEGTLLSEAIPEEGVKLERSQGGPLVSRPGEDEMTMVEVKKQLGLTTKRADTAEIALETTLAMAIRRSLGAVMDGGSIPYYWPVMNNVQRNASPFGWRSDPFTKKKKWHSGMDIAAPKGAPIVAAADGTVVFSGWRVGYGNLVEIKHKGGFVTRYGHTSKTISQVGDRVKTGQLIALVGSTGRSTGNHLHFEVIKDGNRLNPYPFVRETKRDVLQEAKNGRGEQLLQLWRTARR
ncbi:MAG: hypothetical protein COY40_04835 [Alphaproteobacteria bacterium CG_4_10_14_0_8_um_filter_53_9]|nr:MAG: hypothetical protein COY40_04835 [Alphaproteobacteria bacterium CG_4_10_14_0_8_um_filter_53_9]